MMKCRYKKYFSGLIGEFCAKAGLEPARISTVDFESKRSGNLTY